MSLSRKTRLALCKSYKSLKIGGLMGFGYKFYDLFQPKIYGDSRFMRLHERLELLNPAINKGICFSPYYRLSVKESFTGSALFAPTGVGKTTRFHIPNILENDGSMIVIDAFNKEKDSIYHRTSGAKAAQGCKIKSLFFDKPEQSDRLNHLFYCRTIDQSKETARFLAETVAGKDPYWHKRAAAIIHFFQRVLFKSGDKKLMNSFNVNWLVKNFAGNEEGIREFMYKTICPKLDPEDEELKDLWISYLSFSSLNPATLQSVLSTAEEALSPWDSMEGAISQITSEDTMELEKIRKEKTVIYLRFRKTQLDKYELFLNLFLTICMRVLADQEHEEGMLPVFLFLDEFGNLPPIKNFDKLVSTLRDSDVSVNITAQSIAQLRKQYGDDVTEIFEENLLAKLYLGGMGRSSTKTISEVLGETTRQEVVSPKTEDEKDRTITTGVPLKTADKIRRLKEGEGVGIFSNKRPIFFKNLKGYYKYPHLKKLSLVSPFKIHFPAVKKLKRAPLEMKEAQDGAARNPLEHKLAKDKSTKREAFAPSPNRGHSPDPTIPELNNAVSRSVNSALGLG